MKLIILGNGFDLHHNYKTSFSDFREYLINSHENRDQSLIKSVDDLLEINRQKLTSKILWNDFESLVGKILDTRKNNILQKNNVSLLLEKFTERFYQYLLDVTSSENQKINKRI